jgi:hypothetical protein
VKGISARQVEHLVAGHQVGDLPSDPPDERLRRQVLRVELSADSMATFREAVAKLRKQGLDEDGAYLEMARQVLEGPSDPGKLIPNRLGGLQFVRGSLAAGGR